MEDVKMLQESEDPQKSTTAVPARNTVLRYKVGSTSTSSWQQVKNLTDVSGFNGSANMADVTRLDSPGKEKRPGLQDWGQVSIALLINLKESSHMALLAAKKAGSPLDFQLTLSDQSTIEFTAYVKDFPLSAKVDQYLTGSVNLEITGDIVVKPGQ